eukprot:1299484-Prymnesium_polylepis.1
MTFVCRRGSRGSLCAARPMHQRVVTSSGCVRRRNDLIVHFAGCNRFERLAERLTQVHLAAHA